MKEPLPMNADTAKRIAAERLPCICNYKHLPGTALHTEDCPAHYRPAIASALLEAAMMPTREQIAKIIEPDIDWVCPDIAYPDPDFGTPGRRNRARAKADAILAAWSKP